MLTTFDYITLALFLTKLTLVMHTLPILKFKAVYCCLFMQTFSFKLVFVHFLELEVAFSCIFLSFEVAFSCKS